MLTHACWAPGPGSLYSDTNPLAPTHAFSLTWQAVSVICMPACLMPTTPPPALHSSVVWRRCVTTVPLTALEAVRETRWILLSLCTLQHLQCSRNNNKKKNWEGNMKAKDAISYWDLCPIICHKGFTFPYLSENFAFWGGKLLSVAVRCDRQKRTRVFPRHRTQLRHTLDALHRSTTLPGRQSNIFGCRN